MVFSFPRGLFSASAVSIKKSGEVSTIKEYGIDLSKHNGTVNWEKVKKSGVRFAILRAGYSHTLNDDDTPNTDIDITIDKTFNKNYEEAKKHGIKVGVYLYSYATTVTHAIEDAMALTDFIKGKQFEYPIFYDMEDKCQNKLSNEVRTNIAYAFMVQMRAAGYYSGVYASEYWFDKKLNYEMLMENGAIWLAKWTSNDKADLNLCEYGLWQYTSNGKIDGITGRVDLNVSFIDYPSIIKNSGLNGYGSNYNSLYVEPIYSVTYNGAPKKPTPTVMIGERTLKKETDYKITYYNNNRAGLAVAVFKGINGLDSLYARQFFTIKRNSFSKAICSKISTREYTGNTIKPSCTVKDGNTTLTRNLDYKVEYKNNKNIGKATVKITGINYKGSITTSFNIVKRQLKNCDISGIKDLVYNGKTRKFSKLQVSVGNYVFPKTNYTVHYSNNKNIGKAYLTITAKGNYLSGTIKKSFKITPKPVTSFTVSSFSKNTVKLKWNKVTNSSGYIIYRKNNSGKYIQIAEIKDNAKLSFTDKSLSENKYYYKIMSYKTVKGVKYKSFAKSVTAKRI